MMNKFLFILGHIFSFIYKLLKKVTKVKYFIFITLLAISTGCSSIKNIEQILNISGNGLPNNFDPVEYSHVVNLTTSVSRAIFRCSDKDKTDFWNYFQNVNTYSLTLVEYTAHKVEPTHLQESVTTLRIIVKDVVDNTNFSNQYCIHKLSNIQASSRIISSALGGENKIGFCSGGINKRFFLFKDSYEKDKITKGEYANLIADLAMLGQIDSNACNITMRNEALNTINLIKTTLSTLLTL